MLRHRDNKSILGSVVAILGGVTLFTLSSMVFASRSLAAALPTDDLPAVSTQIGGYLAARLARGLNDTRAAAAYYDAALARDADNDGLASQAFDMQATEGNWPRAEMLALQLDKNKAEQRMAQLFLGLAEFKRGHFDKAEAYFTASAINPIGELIALLARAWTRQAQGRTKDALDLLDTTKQPDWAQALIRYHRALLADVGGRHVEALKTYETLFASEPKTLRTLLGYAQSLGNGGDAKGGARLLQAYLDKLKGDGHPYIVDLSQRLGSGETPPLLITTASEGLSEALFGLGEALASEGGVGPGAVFLQFALYLEPSSPFALAALASLYETTKNFDRAIVTYGQILPGSPLEEAIDIHRAYDFASLSRPDEAKLLLDQVADHHPSDVKPLDALGSIMREQKRWDEAIDYYTRAINIIKKPDQRHWTFYYARGTSYERVKKWPLAEADLLKALELNPNEPTVLNYLGYSWVDQRRKLKEGLRLIEKAVKLKPDDGYIVDSLGWAHYRLGDYKEAARWLERAVELRPDDPVLNDHYGDGLWRVGREREATFQWNQALSLNPEADDVEKIKAKLKSGLPALAKAPTPQKRTREAIRNDRRRAESRVPAGPIAQ